MSGWSGRIVYPTRERYVGDFEEGDKHGEGVDYYADGKVKYKGNFRDNLRSDYGVYYYRNGDKYMGWFQNNVPNGKGTYYFADGDKIVGHVQKWTASAVNHTILDYRCAVH